MNPIYLVTSPNAACGISEHSEMLYEALPSALRNLIRWYQPDSLEQVLEEAASLVVIDHHAALHSQWTPDVCDQLRGAGHKVVLIQHDTYEHLDIMKERGLHDFHEHVDALIVHEMVGGLTNMGYDNVYYWIQPVPVIPRGVPRWPEPWDSVKPLNDPPVVGTVGFDFPWKNWEELKDVASNAGWRVRIIGGPDNWMPRSILLQELRECDATAFLYSNANSGTSASIKMGIAARRPLIAYRCRQFRDLTIAGAWDFLWAEDRTDADYKLRALANNPERRKVITRNMNILADTLSWANAGRRYGALFDSLLP